VSQTPHPTACPLSAGRHSTQTTIGSPSVCDRPKGGGGRGAARIFLGLEPAKILKAPHTSTRGATPQHCHAGSKPCVAKRSDASLLKKGCYTNELCMPGAVTTHSKPPKPAALRGAGFAALYGCAGMWLLLARRKNPGP